MSSGGMRKIGSPGYGFVWDENFQITERIEQLQKSNMALLEENNRLRSGIRAQQMQINDLEHEVLRERDTISQLMQERQDLAEELEEALKANHEAEEDLEEHG